MLPAGFSIYFERSSCPFLGGAWAAHQHCSGFGLARGTSLPSSRSLLALSQPAGPPLPLLWLQPLDACSCLASLCPFLLPPGILLGVKADSVLHSAWLTHLTF